MTPRGLRSPALSDLPARIPSGEYEPLYENLPYEDLCTIEVVTFCRRSF